MGYSTSPAAVKRVEPLLVQMMNATGNLSWPSDNAHMLAYHLREAMTVASKDSKSPYHELKQKFMIRNKGTRVVAELRDVTDIVAHIQSAKPKLVLDGLGTLVELVGAVITHEAHEMFFPDARLTEEDARNLWRWATPRDYYLVIGEGITIAKDDPGDAKWTPEA